MLSPGSTEQYSMGLEVPIHWSDQALHVRDFANKYPVPNIIKVTKGQYRNIGVSKSVHSELYLHSVCTISKVLAESVRMKEGKSKMIVSDQKYSLPVTYKGWFELLSQDGKAIKPITSIQELARYYPASCLVRENLKAFILNRESGELSLDRTRTVHAGEVMTLSGEIWVPVMMGKAKGKRRILKCIDSSGEDLYFGLEQKGTFSPIAGQNNISGVHSIKGLLDKFRLPLMVRLVHGVIPTKMEKGFTGVFRFVSIYSDENAFVCPLRRDGKMIPISTRESLKVSPCLNYERLSGLEQCLAIQRRCVEMMDSYTNSIHMLIQIPDSSVLVKGKTDLQNAEVELNVSGHVSRATAPGQQQSVTATSNDQALLAQTPAMSEAEEDLLFQEIDGIYQYVREGGVPPVSPTAVPGQHAPARRISGGVLLDSRQDLRTTVVNNTQLTHNGSSVELKMQQLELTPAEGENQAWRQNMAKKDGYNWEDTIYEPLDKIRAQKYKRQESQESQQQQQQTKQPERPNTGFDSPLSPTDKEKTVTVPAAPDLTVASSSNNISRTTINNNTTEAPVPRKITPPSVSVPSPPPPPPLTVTVTSGHTSTPNQGVVLSAPSQGVIVSTPSQNVNVSPPSQGVVVSRKVSSTPAVISAESGAPVSSLRQVMKSTTTGGPDMMQRRKSAIETSTWATKTPLNGSATKKAMAPPVPPKRYMSSDDATTAATTSDSVEVGDAKNVVTTSAAPTLTHPAVLPVTDNNNKDSYNNYSSKRNNVITNNKNSASTSVSAGGVRGSSSTSASQERHPPYVAVAVVGNYSNSRPGPRIQGGNVAAAIKNFNRSNSVDSSDNIGVGQKLHSMYL